MDKIDKQNFYDFQNGIALYKPTDKLSNINQLINSYLNKTLAMFQYTNLPDTLPDLEIEKMLQVQGQVFITEYNGDVVALKIDLLYEDVDVYGNAKSGNVYYPDTKVFKKVNLSDGVLIKNDYLGLGLLELFKKYAYLLNESALSLNMANFWKRTEKVFTANDDGTAESVKNYLAKTERGEIGLVTSNLLYESIKVNTPQANGTSLGELIEYHNYLKSQLYAEIGLYTNENRKKERLITSEVETGLNAIYPLVDNMLDNRVQAMVKVNEMFDLDIQVEFMSSWKANNEDVSSAANLDIDDVPNEILDNESMDPKIDDLEILEDDD